MRNMRTRYQKGGLLNQLETVGDITHGKQPIYTYEGLNTGMTKEQFYNWQLQTEGPYNHGRGNTGISRAEYFDKFINTNINLNQDLGTLKQQQQRYSKDVDDYNLTQKNKYQMGGAKYMQVPYAEGQIGPKPIPQEGNYMAQMQEARMGGPRKYHEGGTEMTIDDMNAGYDQAHFQEEHHAGPPNEESQYGPNSDNPYGPKPEWGFHFGLDPYADYSDPVSFLNLIRTGGGFGIHGTEPDRLKQLGIDKGKEFWNSVKPTGQAVENIGGFFSGLFQDGGERDDEKYTLNDLVKYQRGGTRLPGGAMKPIPGSDAVEFQGAPHEQGGIMLDSKTEVEGGETMDKVNVVKEGGPKDYFFSDHLKKNGLSYAQQHKQILSNGGNQEDIDMLARMQESQAGRNPNKVQVAKTGGPRLYEHGGEHIYDILGNEVDPSEITDNGVYFKTDAEGKTTKHAYNDGNWVGQKGETVSPPTSSSGKGRGTKYPVASDVYYDTDVYGDIADYQPKYKVGDMTFYAGKEDAAFRAALQGEEFRGNWMGNADPAVLEAAGITNFADMQDPDSVTKYQEAWNTLHPENLITVDGLFGEQTFRTAIGPPDDDGGGSEEEIIEEEEKKVVKKDEDTEILEKKKDWITPVVAAAQLLPAIYAFGDQPDYMTEHPMASSGAIIPERIAKTHLERIDMNPEKARNAADFRSLNRFIETSGGGPSNMMNKMAAYARKQSGDREISAQESRANVAIANQEGVMDQSRKALNVTNALKASEFNLTQQHDVNKFNSTMEAKVDEFNRGADAATTDRRLNALDTVTKSIAGMNKDRLQYNAQERLATAISGQTGVYDREGYMQTLIAGGYVPGTEGYVNMMNMYNKRQLNKEMIKDEETLSKSSSSSTSEETTNTKKTTKKKYDAAGNIIEESVTTAKTGGFIPSGYRRYY